MKGMMTVSDEKTRKSYRNIGILGIALVAVSICSYIIDNALALLISALVGAVTIISLGIPTWLSLSRMPDIKPDEPVATIRYSNDEKMGIIFETLDDEAESRTDPLSSKNYRAELHPSWSAADVLHAMNRELPLRLSERS